MSYMATPYIVLGQRSGKTAKVMHEAYKKLLEDETLTLGVNNKFAHDEMLRLFPSLAGRITIINQYSKKAK